MTSALFAQLLFAFFFTSSAAAAEPMPCDRSMIIVTTDDQDLHQRACNVVMAVMPALEACYIRQKRPISLRFNDTLLGPRGSCLGMYHSGNDQIDLLTPEAFHAQHAQSDFCRGIPEGEHFDSIIVHELVHALLDQVSGETIDHVVDQEYIAYAMQFEIMQKSVRDDFLSGMGLAPPIEAERINEIVLIFSPSAFAASAWLHFSDQENGCDFVGEIIRKEKTFFKEFNWE